MSNTWKHRPPCLVYLAIFNPSLATTSRDRESALAAEDQICLFYSPTTASLDEKARQVGLATALINFTRGGHKVIEYLEDGLQNSILRNVLIRSWEAFKLFHKGIEHIRKTQSIEAARRVLEEFYAGFLPRIDFGTLDLLDAFDGIQFASLPKTSYLQVSSLIQLLKSTFPVLQHPILLWHDHLVWNGLADFETLKPLYTYMTDPETGRVYDGIVNQVKHKGEPVIATRRVSLKTARSSGRTLLKSARRGGKFSGYLVGPTNPGTVGAIELKNVFLGTTDKVEHHLIVYQYEEECTLVVPVPVSSPNKADITKGEFYARLATFLDNHLKTLVNVLADGWASARNLGEFADQHFRYFYYNSMNLAFKTSIGSYKSTVLTADLVQCLNSMHDTFVGETERGHNAVNEMCVKSAVTDSWVVGRRSGSRELYLVFPKSDMGLVDVDDEVKKFTMAYFSDILQ
ncbi:hypothetical protein PhCBS80983_g05693 [Powellomyces hirtus]|uniref:CCZ1/INTU/HPS4 third Longin domain-containing protein n=1 Tax=Powellomyces hirtus TaxID=109895 RepID=A0A507DTQ5_9FUNG|nr:hypothetical protein PhCBS80983_g05693 [Powellomyces hirtus]